MLSSILKLDAAGHPVQWINVEKAAYYVAKDMVLWDMGGGYQTLRGGHNCRGIQSTFDLPTIMAIKGRTRPQQYGQTVPLEKRLILLRDRFTCAYCGQVFRESELEMEHILPESRGGLLDWCNIVAACRGCNAFKADRTPEEAGMPLLYVPYVPNMHEGLILNGRRILGDQMSFLLQGVSRNSRMLGWIDKH